MVMIKSMHELDADNRGPVRMLHKEEDLDADARRPRALETAHRLADLLRRRFGAARVVLFGSLVRTGWFTPWSDIDLAAWGIPADYFYLAVAAVTGESDEFSVDLVDPEICSPRLLQRIERDGVEL